MVVLGRSSISVFSGAPLRFTPPPAVSTSWTCSMLEKIRQEGLKAREGFMA